MVFYSRVTLPYLVRRAYNLESFQLANFAALGNDDYEISAVLPKASSKAQIPGMLRQLLAERFHLVVHSENRPTAVYALTAVGQMPNLKVHKAVEQPEPTGAPGAEGRPQGIMSVGPKGLMHLEGVMTLDALARSLGSAIRLTTDRPVVNVTGVSGEFDITLDARFPMNRAVKTVRTKCSYRMAGHFARTLRTSLWQYRDSVSS
jgi:uncharacterized protein (TIGR03435 family)